jgi:hypothetical protein
VIETSANATAAHVEPTLNVMLISQALPGAPQLRGRRREVQRRRSTDLGFGHC